MAIISMLAVVPRAMQGQPVVYDPHPRDFATHRLVLDDGTNNGFWGILRLTGTLTNDIYIDFPADATGPVIRGNSTGGQSITGGLTVDDLALSTPLSPIYGGTGFSSYAIGDILYANSPTTLARRAIGTTGQVLVVDGGVPQWSNSNVFSSVGGSNPVTGINSGDITAGLPEAITNIGYNDGGGANEPSTTNIAGNTNIGSATGDDGGPTTTTVNGNANFTGTTTFAIAPTIPLATDNLWRGVGGVQTAYAPGAAGTVLTVVGTTPTWSATIGSSSAPENVLGGPLNLNSSAAGSPSTTNINASPATGGTTNIGNGTSTTNVAGTTNLTGPATLSGATTTISSPTTNINTAPNAGGTTTIGNPTSTTQLNGTVNFTNPPTIPLNQNAMWVGNASNVQAAYNSTNVNGAVLAQNASGTPTWTTSTVLAATTGSAPVTNINNGDVNNGSGTESVTNIGYNDPDGGAAPNAASQTNILGNTNLGSNTGSGGGPTTTTVLGTTNLQGPTTNINTAPNAGGTTTIGNPTSTTQLNGTVNFANPPTIPLNQNSIWVGNASNQQQAYASTNVNGAVLAQNASGTPVWSSTSNFTTTAPAAGGATTNINNGDVNSGNNSEATTNIGYNDPDGATATNAASQTNILGNTNLGSNTGSGGGPTTTTVLGTTNLQGSTTNINTAPNAGGTTTIGNPTSTTQLNGTVNFANAPTIPLATDNLWRGVGGVQTAYAPGAAGTVLTVVGTTPTWSATIGSSSAPENVLGGPLNLNSSAAGSPSTTNINASPATGGTTNIGNGTSTTNVAGTTNLTGPATLSGATTTISSPTTNINTAPNAGGTTTIGNPTSTTQLNGTVNFANAPTIPLNQNSIWVGNASNQQQAYASTNVSGAVLAQNASGTPVWSSTSNFTTTAPAGGGATTNINNGDVNSGNNSEATTNIGYNDPDGATATNAASQTNILGNTNLGSNTGSGGGPTTTTVLGTTNLQGPTTNINTAPNAGGTTTIGNPTSTTQLNGTVNFANAPTIPLATDNLWVGVGGVQTAYAPGVAGSVLSIVGTTPTWSSANVLNAQGGLAPVTSINAQDNNVGAGTEAVTLIGYNDPSSGGADNPSTTNIRGNTNVGSNTGDNGGATTTNVLGNTNINASQPNSPNTQTTTIGYNDPDGAGANVPSVTNILGTTNLSGSTNNVGTTDNTPAGGPESQITLGYNDPDGGGPNGPSSTTINGNVSFGTAPTIPLNQNSIWVGNASNQQQAYASTNVNGAVLAQNASGTPVWSSTSNFTTTAPAAGGATTNINNGDVNSGNNSEATTNIGYNDPDGATATNAASQTNILGNTNLGSNTGSGGGPTTTTVLGTTNLQGSTTNINTAPNAGGTTTIGNPTSTTQLNGTVNFANAPTIPLATDNLWVGVGGVQTAYAPGAAGTVLTVVGTTPTWSATIGSSSAPENVLGGPLNLNSSAAGSPSTTNINASPATGGTTNIGNGTSTTNVAGTTNLTGPATLSGATTTISSPTTNINTAPNAGGTTTIGNPTSTTQLNGTVSFANAPTIPLATDNLWVGVGGVQTAYAPGVAGSVLSIVGTTPTWSSTNNFTTTAPAGGGATTNINNGDVNSGNNSEATTNIGYNDPDGATATNAASQTNIFGNTNLGSNTGSGGGATTTNVAGNTNINASNPGSSVVQTTTVGYNDPDGAGANAASQTTVLGNINLNATSPGSTSPQTTTIGYNDPDGGAGNVPSQTTILGNTNINATNPNSPTAQVTTIGYNDPDGGGPNSASSTVFNGNVTFTNPPSLPLATNNLFVGVGGVATALPPTNSSVFVTDGSGVPQWQTIASFLPATAWALAGNAGTTPASQYLGTTDDQDVSFRTNGTERARMYSNTNGGGFGIANAFRPGGLAGSTGQMLASTGSTTAPVWTPSGVLNAVGGTTPVTGVNSGDINNGSGTESVTNIGYTDPDGNTAANGASTTNMLGDVNINTTGPAGTRTTPQTTTIGYNDPDGVGTGVASQTTILGNTNIGSSTGPTTTTFSGNVVFNTAPSIPLATNNLFVGVGGVATALPPTNSSVFVTDGSGVPQWQTIASFLPATAWALAGNAGTTPASQYLGTTDDQDVSFRTNGTERARMYSNTNGGGFGIANAFRPGGLAGSTGQVLTSTGSSTAPVWTSSSVLSSVGGSTPATAINSGDINNGSGTESVTSIGYNDPDGNTVSNGPSTTNVLGDINLNATNPNKGAPQTTTIGYNDPDGGAGNVPSQTTINGNTNINAGPVNSPNTQTTTIGYNDPDGGGTGVASTTNILGNTNIGSATGPTTTTFFGNVVLPSGTTLPLPTNNIFVGVANVATALPPVNSAVLVTNGSGVPQWQTIATFTPNNWSLLGNTGTTPGVGVGQNFMGSTDDRDVVLATNNTERARVLSTTNGGGFRISNAFLPNGLAGSNGQVLTSTGSSTAPAWTSSSVLSSVGGSTPTTGINTGDINPGTGSGEAVTNIGYNDPDGGGTNGPSTTNIAGNTNIGSATGPTTTTFFGNVVLPSGTTLPLAQNNIFVGNASNNAAAVAPGSVGSVLTVNASSTPTWITTNVLSATAGATPLTGINSSDVNPGTNTESTTNIGYNDPDGATATNGPSVTNIRGNTTIGSATGNGGGPTTTTINGDMVFGNPGAIRNALGIYSGRVANSTGSNTTTVTVTGATFTANTVIEISWEEAGAGTSTYLQYKVVNRSGAGGNQFTVSFSAIPPAGFINYIVHQ